MMSLGNIALSLKDRVMSLKSDYNVYFSLSSSFFGSKSFLHLVLLLTRLFSSSSDVGMKNLANSLTREGPMHVRGSSWMSCNLSVSESLLLWGALAFSACTCFLDPLSLGHCRGITRIHRSPSRPSHSYGRQPHWLIFMSTLYKATSCLPASS